MKRPSLLYVLTLALFIAGVLVALSRNGRAGSIFLIGAGATSIAFARSHAAVQSRINKATQRFTWNPWGDPGPLLFVVWGAGMVIIGLAWLFT